MGPRSEGDIGSIYSTAFNASGLRQGVALWYPEPHESGEVRIGDVGYIREGAFVRLLHVASRSPKDEVTYWGEISQWPGPMLDKKLLREDPRSNSLRPGRYCSKGVERRHSAVSVQGYSDSHCLLKIPSCSCDPNLSGAMGGSGGGTVEFTCKETYGAMLHLQSPTKASSLYDSKGLRQFILQNFGDWAHFAQEDPLDLLDAKKILFVRGWVKTSSDWTTTAFANAGSKLRASLDGGVGPVAGVGIEFTRSHSVEGPVFSREGATAGTSTANQTNVQDQTVFVKCYSVKKRPFLPDKLEAAGGPGRLPSPDPEDLEDPIPAYEVQVTTENEAGLDTVSHPSSRCQKSSYLSFFRTPPPQTIR